MRPNSEMSRSSSHPAPGNRNNNASQMSRDLHTELDMSDYMLLRRTTSEPRICGA